MIKMEVGAGRYQPLYKKDKVNQQMADKNLIGGKYTVNLSILQVFLQKSDFFLHFYCFQFVISRIFCNFAHKLRTTN